MLVQVNAPPPNPFAYGLPQNPPSNPMSSMKPTKLHIGIPEAFDGSYEKAVSWITTAQFYLHVNAAIYNDDDKRITFALSCMSKGSTLTWATTYWQTAISGTTVTLGTYTEFLTKFNDAFKHHDTVGNAINWLSTTRMNKADGSIVISLEKYIALFKSNIALAGITDPNVLVGYFTTGLHPKLMEQMMAMETLPSTIDKWYEKATTFQTQWQRAREIATKQRSHSFVPKTTHDPNTMVVDVIKVGKLTPEERK
jgi:hypothetical protein